MPSHKKTAKRARQPRSSGPRPPEPLTVLTTAVRFADQEILQFHGRTQGLPLETAEAALESLGPRLATYPESKLVTPRLDVQRAILAGFALHARITETPPLLARYQKQHVAGEFDIANLELLQTAALAAFQAHREAQFEEAVATDAVVPEDVVAKAREVEARMQALCEYLFDEDPEIAPLLKLYRPGTGHRDLARDLQGYASIYDMRAAIVAKDGKHYRPTDRDDAFRLAAQIQEHRSKAMFPDRATADLQFRRAWALYADVHAEVRRVGLYLHDHDPGKDELFPSLFAVARPVRGKGRKPSSGGPEAPALAEGVDEGAPEVKKKARKVRRRSRGSK